MRCNLPRKGAYKKYAPFARGGVFGTFVGRAGEFNGSRAAGKKIATGADLIASGIFLPNRKQACVRPNQKKKAQAVSRPRQPQGASINYKIRCYLFANKIF